MDSARQIEQMKQFILSEAKEKAEEITTKSQNEAYAWKMDQSKKLKDEIEQACAKEVEAHKVQKRVEQANKLKQQRDRVLAARAEAVETLRKNAEAQMKQLTSNNAKYTPLLRGLIVQAAAAVAVDGQKTSATVRCRKQDKSLVEQNLNAVTSVSLKLDSTSLDDKVLGGVIVSAQGGKILCNNTLSHRLENCMEELMPLLRDGLFNQ